MEIPQGLTKFRFSIWDENQDIIVDSYQDDFDFGVLDWLKWEAAKIGTTLAIKGIEFEIEDIHIYGDITDGNIHLVVCVKGIL